MTARNDRDTGTAHRIFSLLLIAKARDDICIRPYKGDPALLTQIREPTVLREKSKARVDCICT